MKTTGVILAVALLLAGCASEGTSADEPTTAADDDTTTSAPVEDAKSEPSADCKRVSRAMARAIATGREDGTGLKARRAVAVESPDFSKVYFIAMEFSAPGIGKDVGVWASNSLKPGGGIIMAADGMAQEFTVWPDADSTDAQISKADPSIESARSCL